MTRFKKLIIAGLMVLVTTCVSLGTSLFNITQSIFSSLSAYAYNLDDYHYSNENTTQSLIEGDILTISNVPTTGKRGLPINIPSTGVTTNRDTGVVTNRNVLVEIRNPYGDLLVDKNVVLDSIQVSNPGVAGDPFVLTPGQIGIYTVQYASQNASQNIDIDGVWSLSDIYQIKVTAESYSISFASNDPIVLPEKLDTNTDIDKTVFLPLPMFYDQNGNQINEFVLGDASDSYYYVATHTVLTNVWLDENNSPVAYVENDPNSAGKNVYATYPTYIVTKHTGAIDTATYNYALAIEVKVPGASTQTNLRTQTPTNLLVLDETNFAEEDESNYVESAYNFEANSGKNIITYKICKSDFTNYATPYSYISRSFDGSNSYDSSKIELKASVPSNIKSSATSVNVKTYLPTVSTVDSNNSNNSVNAYYSYNVVFVDDTTSTDVIYATPNKVKLGVDEGGVYFIPLVVGTYNISYNAVDFYGNSDENSEDYDYDVIVSDRTSPSLNLVTSFDFDDLVSYNIENDYSYVIPTKYVINQSENSAYWTKITVPAIYTQDNLKTFGQLKIKRTITSESGFKNSENNVVNNYTINIQSNTGLTDSDINDTTNKIDIDDVVTFDTVEQGTLTNFFVDSDGVFRDDITGEALAGEALVVAKSSQVAYITLNPALFGEGTYTIEYSVSDGVYSNNSGKTFTFELVNKDDSNPIDTTAPVVEFGTSTVGQVVDNQTITIAKPTITDEVDNNTYNRYYVVVGSSYLQIFANDEGNLVFNTKNDIVTGDQSIFDLAELTSTKSFKIVAFAYDDFANLATDPTTIDLVDYAANPENYPNIGIGSCEISIKDTTDSKAPKITVRSGDVATENDAYNQFEEKLVNGITFYDDTNSAKISVKVVDSNGLNYAYQELSGWKTTKLTPPGTMYDAGYIYEYYFPGISFVANKSDNYTITYTITDNGNNVTVYSFVLRQATDKQAPNISGLLGTTATIELGSQSYSFSNAITATDNSSIDENIDITIDCAGAIVGNCSSWFNNPIFTPRAADDYTITVIATDEAGNESTRTFKIIVKDTKAPTLSLVGDNSDKILVDEREDDGVGDVDWDEDIFPEVTLPGFIVEDEYQDLLGSYGYVGATGKLTITTPDNDSYVIDVNGDLQSSNVANPLGLERRSFVIEQKANYYFYFTPTERGHYTATYTGEDLNGNSATSKTIDIYIGDTEIPQIYLTSTLSTTLSNGFVLGNTDELIINPQARIYGDTGYTTKDLYIKDNYGFNSLTDTSSNKYMVTSISVVNENNNTVSQIDNDDDLVYYEFTTAGTYTITFTVTDQVGNTGTLSKTFKVTATTATTTDSAKILGTILIIVSAVILLGVVIYFIKGTKFIPKKHKKTQKPTTDKKD